MIDEILVNRLVDVIAQCHDLKERFDREAEDVESGIVGFLGFDAFTKEEYDEAVKRAFGKSKIFGVANAAVTGLFGDVAHDKKSTRVRGTTVDFPYAPLYDVLMDAYSQSASGKGKERHGNDLPFVEQPIMKIAEEHGLGFLTGQAVKKLGEAHKLLELKGTDAAQAEILGAIVYSAAAVLHLRNKD